MIELKGLAYVPTMLNGMDEICDRLKVGKDTVRQWIEEGAPIIVEDCGKKKRYCAELAELHAWRKHQAGLR